MYAYIYNYRDIHTIKDNLTFITIYYVCLFLIFI